MTMDSVTSRPAEDDKIVARAPSCDSQRQMMRLSRLQVSEFHLDIDGLDDESTASEGEEEDRIHDEYFKQGEIETIRKGETWEMIIIDICSVMIIRRAYLWTCLHNLCLNLGSLG